MRWVKKWFSNINITVFLKQLKLVTSCCHNSAKVKKVVRLHIYNNNNNNSHDNIYGAVIMTKVIARVHRFIWWMQTERRVAANPQIKPVDLGCESAENWQLSSMSTIAIVIITQSVSWYSFYRPTKGGKLSRPKHCSKGAQPVLKTVYHSSCRDKHNCQRRDSNLGPLTPQSDTLTTRLLRPTRWLKALGECGFHAKYSLDV